MEEILGTNVEVVLSVKEGNGFSRIEHPTAIVATLNGHSLETDLIDPSPNPQYGTDLVWDADKSSVRKMRVGHVPLKIECFAFDDNGLREKIGYILLTIRSAQVIPRSKNVTAKVTWHRLLGVKSSLRSSSPELLLSLSIEETDAASDGRSHRIEGASDAASSAVSIGTITPRLLHEERLIQLGSQATCHDIFLLSITAGIARNVEKLAKQEIDHPNENFTFCYQILNNNVQLKSFNNTNEKPHHLNEKIVIRLRTSMIELKNYFQANPYLIVKLQYGRETVGQSKVDLRSLVDSENAIVRANGTSDVGMTLNQQCFLDDNNFESADQSERPSIDIQLRLCQIESKTNKLNGPKNVTSVRSVRNHSTSPRLIKSCSPTAAIITGNRLETEYEITQKMSDIDSHRNPGGDFTKCTNHPLTSGEKIDFQSNCNPLKQKCPPAMFSHSADAILHGLSDSQLPKTVEAYHCYCLRISLESIEFHREKNIKNIDIRFHHPKAQVMSTMHPKMSLISAKKLTLQDIQCKLHFISSADEIKKLLTTYPPRICIFDADNDVRICLAQAIIRTQQSFTENNPECICCIPLLDVDENEVGVADARMHLEDCGPYYRTKRRKSDEELGPPILDDTLVYKIVEELETWKERQQEIFRAELRKKEERHLNFLSDEWQKRKQALETKLASGVEQCKSLASKLNEATTDLRARRLRTMEKEANLDKVTKDLQWRYDHKMQELREASKRFEDDLVHKLSIAEDHKNVLEGKLQSLQLENEKLRNVINRQAEESANYQKGALTRDQTASLLQELEGVEEKLNQSQKSKSFFKEQWGKAVREIHRLRIEHQKSLEVHIRNSKEELKSMDLEEVLCTDSKELLNDQILLGEIQKEINVIKPRQSFVNMNTTEQLFAPPSNLYSKSSHSIVKSNLSTKTDEMDERLKNLIEERDSLLKTGSYTTDDAVIMKLNTEIRSLLITS